jgi:3'-phosphoadenosine 5'-phosphosulfate sulfotransferase
MVPVNDTSSSSSCSLSKQSLTDKYFYAFAGEFVEKGMVDIYEELDEETLESLMETINDDMRYDEIRNCIEKVVVNKKKKKKM